MYHEGEIAVQDRAGVREFAEQAGRGIRASIPPAAVAFLASQRFAVFGSVAADGRVWASVLVGRPGFLSAPDEGTLNVDGNITAGDPLAENLRHRADLGVLVLDPSTRRRMRVNGEAELGTKGFSVRVREAFSNCPKYIQMRTPRTSGEAGKPFHIMRREQLTEDQTNWIQSADTFFIATHHSVAGADASHRGGMPGFVRVTSDQTLVWPDYSGNNMFQSFGNLERNPKAGLLFMDFESGSTLQIAGDARVLWDDSRTQQFPGARRLVEFHVGETIETTGAFSERWRLEQYSPVNPRP